ncbi:hypothetical protein KY311_04485 [Candidatus Woesearchaeota archaeon]|nr:hypothetical protein [Candidatus Woesearchaeota archaeon]
MNKKAAVSTYLTDFAAFIVFVIFVLMFFVLFKVSNAPAVYQIVSSNIYSRPDYLLSSYMRSPVMFDVDKDGINETLQMSELVILLSERKVDTSKFYDVLLQMNKPIGKDWDMQVQRSDEQGRMVFQHTFGGLGHSQGGKELTFATGSGAFMYIPTEDKSELLVILRI